MKVDQEACSGCKLCTKVCTVGAISMNEDKNAFINLDLCVECGVCKRIEICPTDAIIEEELAVTEPKTSESVQYDKSPQLTSVQIATELLRYVEAIETEGKKKLIDNLTNPKTLDNLSENECKELFGDSKTSFWGFINQKIRNFFS